MSKKQIESLRIKGDQIEAMKQYLSELEKHKNHFSGKKQKIEKDDVVVEIEGSKDYVKKFPDNK